MKKVKKCFVILISILLMLPIFMSCNNKNISKDTFDIEQFQSEMKTKGYDLQIKDSAEVFIPTTTKITSIDNELVIIYLFDSNESMEKEAKNIKRDGSESSFAKVKWSAPPHFYKKGSIIVQYIGGNKKIISDLKNILGEQFAGAV